MSSWSLLLNTTFGNHSLSVLSLVLSFNLLVSSPSSSPEYKTSTYLSALVAFYGSFIDCLMAMPLGALLVLVQVIVSRNDLYASLFE